MPICIECSQPVPQLYHVLSSKKKSAHSTGPDDRTKAHRRNLSAGASGGGTGGASAGGGAGGSGSYSNSGSTSSGNIAAHASTGQTGSASGGNAVSSSGGGSGGGFKGGGEAKKAAAGAAPDVRLTQCPRCKRFADKYVEHDLVVLFIDLVLVKPQVYRHLLFNRLAPTTATTAGSGGERRNVATGLDSFDPAIQRLGVLLVLFDVYLTWSAIETSPSPLMQSSSVPRLPILAQYVFYLVLCSLTAVTQHLVVRELSQLRWFRGPDIPVMEPAMVPGTVKGGGGPAVTVAAAAATGGPGSSAIGTGSGSSTNNSSNSNSSPQKRRQNTQPPVNAAAAAAAAAASLPSRPSSAASASKSRPQSPIKNTPLTTSTTAATDPHQSHHQQPPPHPNQQTHSVPQQIAMRPPPPPHKNAVSTALFVSSCMRLFPILMVVWTYEDKNGQLATGVSWAVALQNVEALRILLGCGYGAAGVLVGAGWAASALVGRVLLASVGLRALSWGG